MAWWMVAALSERAPGADVGAGLFSDPRIGVLISRCHDVLQHRAHAEAPAVPGADDRPGRLRRVARGDRVDLIYSRRARAGAGHLLVLRQSRGFHVPLHLVSWHVPAISL